MLVQEFVPVTFASIELGLTREVVIRLIQRGVITGGLVAGRWVCDRRALDQYISKCRAPERIGVRGSIEGGGSS